MYHYNGNRFGAPGGMIVPSYPAQGPIHGLGSYAAYGGIPGLETLRCLAPEIPNPVDIPLLPTLAAVVAINLAASAAIAIPPRYENRLLAYAADNPADGRWLRIGHARCPRYRSGGPILRLQPHAKAMTLDRNVFVDGALDINTYVHEMVHVAQYKILGVGPFLISYFGISGLTILARWLRGTAISMMRSSPHETQAYDIASRFMSWLSTHP